MVAGKGSVTAAVNSYQEVTCCTQKGPIQGDSKVDKGICMKGVLECVCTGICTYIQRYTREWCTCMHDRRK